MTSIVVVGEDALCCSLGESLVAQCLPGWTLPLAPIDTRGVTKLRANLFRYHGQLVHLYPVLCVADTDRACAVEMRAKWLPDGIHQSFLLRLAVCEADSWVLADRAGFAKAFGVSMAAVPRKPEALADAKREVLRLAVRSSRRVIRDEVPAVGEATRPGSGYNQHLCAFVRETWNAANAAQHAPSLARAIKALKRLGNPQIDG